MSTFAERLKEERDMWASLSELDVDIRIAERSGDELAVKEATDARRKAGDAWLAFRIALKSDIADTLGVSFADLRRLR